MVTTFKIRIYPNKKQKELIEKTFGCSRFVYNYFLNRKQECYENEKKSLNYNACSKELTMLKQELIWLKEVDKWSLQNSLKILDNAFKNFFNGSGYPKFKSKKDCYKSYKTTFSNNNIEIVGNYLKLPKLKKVKFRDKYIIKGKILNVTITKTNTNKYFASICVEVEDSKPYKKTGKNVGLDLGIETLITLSDGIIFENNKYLKKTLEKLAILQQQLSRKTSGSKNREKARIKVAKCYEKISNQRNDHLQKTTTKIIRDYDIICLEGLDLKKLIEEKKMSLLIQDASWGKLVNMLTYKALRNDKIIVKVDTFFPSSQLCNFCGYKNKDVKDLKVRKWTCPQCGNTHNRDINASINILNEGLRLLNN